MLKTLTLGSLVIASAAMGFSINATLELQSFKGDLRRNSIYVQRFAHFSAPALVIGKPTVTVTDQQFLLDTATGRIWKQVCGTVGWEAGLPCSNPSYHEIEVANATDTSQLKIQQHVKERLETGILP